VTDITVEVVATPAIEVTVTQAGAPGMSAYQHAVANGFEGTVEEWLASLSATTDPAELEQAIEDYLTENPQGGAVDSVAGKTGVVTLVKGDVGLGSVDNTSDADKPVSTATAAAIAAVGGGSGSDAGVAGFFEDAESDTRAVADPLYGYNLPATTEVGHTLNTTSGSVSGSTYSDVSWDITVAEGFVLESLAVYRPDAATYTLKIDAVTIDTAAGTGDLTFDVGIPLTVGVHTFRVESSTAARITYNSGLPSPFTGSGYSFTVGGWAAFPSFEIRAEYEITATVAADGAPSAGAWTVGARVWNPAPAAGEFIGWVCVTAGTPGTWKGFGEIEA